MCSEKGILSLDEGPLPPHNRLASLNPTLTDYRPLDFSIPQLGALRKTKLIYIEKVLTGETENIR